MKMVTVCCEAETVCYPETPFVVFCSKCDRRLNLSAHHAGDTQVLFIDEVSA